MKRLALFPMLGLAGCLFVTEAERLEHTDFDGDGVAASEDCDDAEASVGLARAELCDGNDNDCDGDVDEGLVPDEDGDGFGATGSASTPCFVHWVSRGGDCDDNDASTFPGAPERCDGRQNDCESAWEPTDELGIVTWTGLGGELEDLSATFASGAPGAPVQVSLPTSGSLSLCATDPAYYARLVGAAVEDLSIIGRPIPRPDDLTGAVVLNAASSMQVGAAIEVTGDDWIISIRGLKIVGGQAGVESSGGGLRLRGGRKATLRDLEVTANLAGEDSGGAGMYLDDVDRVSLLDSLVAENTAGAGSHGGGVLARSVDLRIDNVTFDGNSARGYGGAVMIDVGRLSLSRSVLSSNEGADGGGGVYVGTGVDAFFYNSTFVGNLGDQGGAAWVQGSVSCFDDRDGTTFIDHEARYRGALWAVFDDGRGSFDGCTTSGAWVSSPVYPQAQLAPDMFVGASNEPEGRYYEVTGDSLFCTSAYCNGDVAEFSSAR